MSQHTKSRPRLLIVGSKALLFDVDLGNKLFQYFFGKPFGVDKPKPEERFDKPFVLSLYEALYLCKKGVVDIVIEGREASCSDLEVYAEKIVPNFRVRYMVYEDLRDRGYIVRSGLKFGTDFAVYELGPGYEHSPYVVYVVEKGSLIDPIALVRLGRVSHSVRKRFILAIVDSSTNKINYLVFKWVKL